MLEVNIRDTNIKPKKIRREGLTTGTLRRINGDIIPISMVGRKVEQYVSRYGDYAKININLFSEDINTRIIGVYRDVLKHNIIDIDLLEI